LPRRAYYRNLNPFVVPPFGGMRVAATLVEGSYTLSAERRRYEPISIIRK
jgi:hypothetical protein